MGSAKEKGIEQNEQDYDEGEEIQAHLESINIQELLRAQNIKNLQAYWHLMRKQPHPVC